MPKLKQLPVQSYFPRDCINIFCAVAKTLNFQQMQLSKSSWRRLHQKIEKKLVKFVPGSIFSLLKKAHVATRGIVSLYCYYTIMIFMYSKSFKILLFTFIISRPKHVQQNIK